MDLTTLRGESRLKVLKTSIFFQSRLKEFLTVSGETLPLRELRSCIFCMVHITGTVDLAGLIKVLILATLSEEHASMSYCSVLGNFT